MRVSAFALVMAGLLAGCGGHGAAAKPNGEATKPAARVFADATAAATGASSAHVSGSVVVGSTPITLSLDMARGKGAKGSAAISGLQFGLVQIGGTAYIHGSDAFYKHFAGALIAQLLHGKWIKASVSEPRFRAFAPLTSIAAIFARASAGHGKLVNDGETAYQGQRVVAIRDTSDNSRLYVASTGTPYPVALVSRKTGQSGTIAFGNWNKTVSLTAPQGAIDISKVTGG